jgi:hypothetical protein
LRTLRLVGSACGLLRLLFIALSLSSAFLNAKASIVSPPVPSKGTTGRANFLTMVANACPFFFAVDPSQRDRA